MEAMERVTSALDSLGFKHRHEETEEKIDYFEIIIDSTVEGVSKPAPAIFELALERMKISPSEAAHVGDMYGADVMGARDAGMAPVWYNRSRLKPQADYRPDLEVERLTGIPEIL